MMTQHVDAQAAEMLLAEENSPVKKDNLALVSPSQVDPAIADNLVEQARANGVELVGPDGLLGQLAKEVLEADLEVEMEELALRRFWCRGESTADVAHFDLRDVASE